MYLVVIVEFYDVKAKLQTITHSPLRKRYAAVEQRYSCTGIGAALGKI